MRKTGKKKENFMEIRGQSSNLYKRRVHIYILLPKFIFEISMLLVVRLWLTFHDRSFTLRTLFQKKEKNEKLFAGSEREKGEI